jgi:hypothetical protein
LFRPCAFSSRFRARTTPLTRLVEARDSHLRCKLLESFTFREVTVGITPNLAPDATRLASPQRQVWNCTDRRKDRAGQSATAFPFKRDKDRPADHCPTPGLVLSGSAARYAPPYATTSSPMIARCRRHRSAVPVRRMCPRYILGFTRHRSRTRNTGTRAVVLVAHEAARFANLKPTPPMITTAESMRTTMIFLLALLAVGPALASEKTDVMVPVHQFLDGFNKGNMKTAGGCLRVPGVHY